MVSRTSVQPRLCSTKTQTLEPGFHQRISISTNTCVSKCKLGRHKHKHRKNGQVRSSCACTYAYVVALTIENGLDLSTSISIRPWTNHRSLSPRSHANISNAIWPWRTLRPPSCFSLGRGELVPRIESNMPFFACVCPYALVKTRLNDVHTTYWLKILAFKFFDCFAAWRPYFILITISTVPFKQNT